MENLEPVLLWVAGICGAIGTIWALIDRAFKPVKEMVSRLDEIEKVAAINASKLNHDHESFVKQEEINILVLKSCSLLMKHGADNNHTGELSRQAKEIDDLIFKKSGSL